MSHITVVFTRRRRIGSALIRTWMHSRFSHCAFVVPGGDTVIEASWPGGVRERSLADLVAESSHREFVRIPCRSPTAALLAARRQLGKPYDWRGVLGFWLRRNWQRDDAFLCSELIAWILWSIGEPAFRREAHRVSPESLYLPLFDR